MAIYFSTIPTSYTSLSKEIIRLVDLFRLGQLNEQTLTNALAIWAENTPQFLFSPEDQGLLAPQVARSIGKRRCTVVLTVLRRQKTASAVHRRQSSQAASRTAP